MKIIFTVLVMLFFVAIPISEAQYGQPQPPRGSVISQLIIDDENVLPIWSEYDPASTLYELTFRVSQDNGSMFNNQVDVFDKTNGTGTRNSSTIKYSDRIVLSESETIYYIGIQYNKTENHSKISIFQSKDYGQTFSLSETYSIDYPVVVFDAGVSGKDIHLLLNDLSYGKASKLLYAKVNFDDSFKIQNLSIDPDWEADHASIILSEDSVYVVYAGSYYGKQEGSVFFTKSNDGGNSFSTPINLSGKIQAFTPQMVVDESNVYVVWMGGHSNIVFTKSNDGGNTFSQNYVLNSNRTQNTPNYGSRMPEISLGNTNTIYAKWEDNGRVFFTKSNDGGNTFDKTINLTGNPSNYLSNTTLDSYGNYVYVTWQDLVNYKNHRDMYFVARSNDAGNSFEYLANLNVDDGMYADFSNILTGANKDRFFIMGDTGGAKNYNLLFRYISHQESKLSDTQNLSTTAMTVDNHKPFLGFALSPHAQQNMGVLFNSIECKQDLVLIQKYDGSPACVTKSTKQKLIERGWTTKDSAVSVNGCEKDVPPREDLVFFDCKWVEVPYGWTYENGRWQEDPTVLRLGPEPKPSCPKDDVCTCDGKYAFYNKTTNRCDSSPYVPQYYQSDCEQYADLDFQGWTFDENECDWNQLDEQDK